MRKGPQQREPLRRRLRRNEKLTFSREVMKCARDLANRWVARTLRMGVGNRLRAGRSDSPTADNLLCREPGLPAQPRALAAPSRARSREGSRHDR